MRRVIAATTVIAALIGTPALAADMALKAPTPPAPVLSWTGFYIGVNAGGGWAGTEWQNNHVSLCPGNGAFTVSSCDIGQRATSFIGGGQIGARVQTGQFVFGIEGTADYARFRASSLDPTGAIATALGGTSFLLTDTTRLSGLYTVTGQGGLAWDRWLGYAKGGWAGSRLYRDMFIASPVLGTFNDGNVSQQANGWTVGTGFEYRLTSLPGVSVGLEYDYIRLRAGNVAACVTGTQGSGFSCAGGTLPLLFTGFHANVNEVLFRANYTFNWMGR